MATNNFKAFALDPNANVTSQADWEALPALLSGFTAGKASSAQVNKAIRQASFIAAALAQYTADKSGEDVLDDGDISGFIAKMSAAFGEDFQPKNEKLTAFSGLAGAANRLPYFTGANALALTALTAAGRNLIGQADVPAILEYLGLGDTSGYVGRWVNTRVFTSSGTYTPTPGTKRIRVTITGGGGGGGGCKAISNNETFFGAGGGAGGTVITILTPTQNSYPVTIGAGGAGGVSATNGLKGGDSSFGSVIAPGGEGAGKVGVTNTNGGNGGVPNIGDIRITGGDGGDGQSGNIGVSGEGGASYWGGGGRAGAGGGVRGRAFGSGGGGAYDAGYSGTSMTGGKGADGVCIIEEFA